MKKLIYILLLAFVTGTTVVSCTEEPVTPQRSESGPGGAGSDPVKP